jgi:mRNA interferase MazF
VLERVVVVPLTTSTHKVYPSEALVTVDGKPAKAMADQIATASKRRLRERLDRLSLRDLRLVEDAILLHLAIGGR